MCKSCLQTTFGESVDLPAVVPRVADKIVCSGCENEAVCKEAADGNNYCDDCYGDDFADCTSCDKSIKRDDCRTSEDGDDYCEDCYYETYSSCEDCDGETLTDELETVTRRARYSSRRDVVRHVCSTCRRENYTSCADCDNVFKNEDSSGCNTSGDSVCEGCAENYFYCEGCESTCCMDDYAEDGRCNNCDNSDDDDGDGPDVSGQKFKAGTTCRRPGSMRRFGIELETSECPGYAAVAGETCFNAVADGSIDGKEFVSEILSGDAGCEAIAEFCRRAKSAGFKVDAKCGFHAHFDVSDLNIDQLKSVALAYRMTNAVWRKFVDDKRRTNTYCGDNDWDRADLRGLSTIRDFRNWADGVDRYQWFNVAAYAEHKTFEVRLHGPTLDACKVVNWVVAHIRFIDVVSKMSFDDVRAKFSASDENDIFAFLAECWANEDLTGYYHSRAAGLGTTFAQPSHVVA